MRPHARTSECKRVRASDSINSEVQKGGWAAWRKGFGWVSEQNRENKGSSWICKYGSRRKPREGSIEEEKEDGGCPVVFGHRVTDVILHLHLHLHSL